MADGCFLVLCGIPASGKSTLAKELIKKDWKIAGKRVHFTYINYDDFIPESLHVDDLTHAARWKERRRDVIRSLQQLLLSKESDGSESISQRFNEKSTFVSSWCPCGVNQIINRASDIMHVMVIDDNMYYRSMRYEYYQLARKSSFSFAEVYLQCPVDVALTRNEQRTTSVSEDTIIKMFHHIEKPESGKFSWERFSVTVDTSRSQNADNWKSIMKLLEDAVAVPMPAVKVPDDIQKTKDRAITEKSIVHQADQIIRKHISQKLEEMRAKSDPSDVLKKEAQCLNQRRKMVMEQFKKEPKHITRHVFCRHFNIFCLGDHSEDTLYKSETAVSETKKSNASFHPGRWDLSMDESFSIDESFLWENFWDIISCEEFSDIVRDVFEQT